MATTSTPTDTIPPSPSVLDDSNNNAAALAELSRLVHAYEVHRRLAHKHFAEQRELKHLLETQALAQQLADTHSLEAAECERLARAYSIFSELCAAEDRRLAHDELEHLAAAVAVQEKLLAAEKTRLGQEHALEDDLALRELARLERAFRLQQRLSTQPDTRLTSAELERSIATQYISDALSKRHQLDTAECEKLATAYHIARSLCERENRELERQELENLAQAAFVQDKLLDAERKRLARASSLADLAARHELERLTFAYNVHQRLAAAEAGSEVDLAELHSLRSSQHIAENLAHVVHDLEAEECERLAHAYRIMTLLTERENRQLEQEELRHLVHAARVQEKLIAAERARLQQHA